MSSSQLTLTPSFFRGVAKKPPTRNTTGMKLVENAGNLKMAMAQHWQTQTVK